MYRHNILIESLVKRFSSSDPDTYTVQTHISTVILTENSAYKIKKPVDFGFLDFSTLEKRENFCKEEMRVNSRFSPSLYLGVTSIGGSVQNPVLDADENIIEYAVHMKRFKQEDQLDRVASSGRLGEELVDQMAKKIAELHKTAIVAEKSSEYGDPERVLRPVAENFEMLEDSPLSKEARDKINKIKEHSFKKHKELKAFFTKRKETGFVRECHGDLHLANIALVEGEIMLFDAIEFNPFFRWIDIISDLCFLLMDMDFIGKKELSNRLLNLYLEETGDYESLEALSFYKTYRAMVRVKVTALRLCQKEINNDEKKRLEDNLDAYLDLALEYTKKSRPYLAIMHGFSGCGKSRFALCASGMTAAIRVRSDRERMRLFSHDIYTKEATKATYNRLKAIASWLIDIGFSVIVDATFLKEWQRALFKEISLKKKRDFFILNAVCDDKTAISRIAARLKEESDISQADLNVFSSQKMGAEPFTKSEMRECIAIDCNTDDSMQSGLQIFIQKARK